MGKIDKNEYRETIVTNIPEQISTDKHRGHRVRSGRKIVDRSKIGKVEIIAGKDEKLPNQYTGHTYKNKWEKLRLDGHKLIYHLDRIFQWQKGERIAPVQIDMGLTKFCNVACIYCIGVTQGGMKKGEMIETDVLLRFIEDCGKLGVRAIGFIGDGEPTLNPAMYDAATLAKNLGIDIGIGTNGLLIDMEKARALLHDSSFIRINLSAGDAEGFKRIHQVPAGKFGMLLDKIRTLVKIKRENNYDCTIGIQMVLIPENFNQIFKLTELSTELGVDYLQIKQCSDTEYKELGIKYEDYNRVIKVLKKVESLSNEDFLVKVKWNKINISKETEIYKGTFRKYDVCYGTPFLGQISGNGKVYPCGPFFGKERFCMGDIHTQSYYDIVKGDRYRDVHKDIMDNVDVHYDCTIGCRQDYINKFLWDLKNPPDHLNFI